MGENFSAFPWFLLLIKQHKTLQHCVWTLDGPCDDPFYGLHLSLLRKPIITLVLSCEPVECLANSLTNQLKNNVFQTFVIPLSGSHLLFLVFCRNVRPETESWSEKTCDTMWTSVSSEINSPESAKELKLRCILSTNETRCSGFGPVRLNSRRLLEQLSPAGENACLQILILQNLPQTTITFNSTILTFNIKQMSIKTWQNLGVMPVYQLESRFSIKHRSTWRTFFLSLMGNKKTCLNSYKMMAQ